MINTSKKTPKDVVIEIGALEERIRKEIESQTEVIFQSMELQKEAYRKLSVEAPKQLEEMLVEMLSAQTKDESRKPRTFTLERAVIASSGSALVIAGALTLLFSWGGFTVKPLAMDILAVISAVIFGAVGYLGANRRKVDQDD